MGGRGARLPGDRAGRGQSAASRAARVRRRSCRSCSLDVGAAIPTLCFITGIRLLGAPRAAILATLEPVVGVGSRRGCSASSRPSSSSVGGALDPRALSLLQVGPGGHGRGARGGRNASPKLRCARGNALAHRNHRRTVAGPARDRTTEGTTGGQDHPVTVETESGSWPGPQPGRATMLPRRVRRAAGTFIHPAVDAAGPRGRGTGGGQEPAGQQRHREDPGGQVRRMTRIPDNDPHVGCTFNIEFRGYDSGRSPGDLWGASRPMRRRGNGEIVKNGELVYIGGDLVSCGGGKNDLRRSSSPSRSPRRTLAGLTRPTNSRAIT